MTLDAEAHAAIEAALHACAARTRDRLLTVNRGGEAGTDAAMDDPAADYVILPKGYSPYRGVIEPPTGYAEVVPFVEGESQWQLAGAEVPEGWLPREGEGEDS
ncbi:MAG: hypothetical protein K2Y20_08115 [Sphingomonas sp.]|nr:hypothetical protein [Sphingomonas sp.]